MTLRLQPQPRQQKRTRPYIAQEMEEKGLRFEIPYRRGHASDKDTKLHAQRLKDVATSEFRTDGAASPRSWKYDVMAL